MLALISSYQRHLSPRKGWRCAYSVLHGGTGCSGYIREAIQQRGYKAAIPLARARFRDCKSASQTLRHFSPNPLDAPSKKEETPSNRGTPIVSGDCFPDLDCGCAETALDCGPHMGLCDAGACDAGACHLGHCCSCF